MVKLRTSLDPTQLNVSNQTPYLDIKSEQEKDTKAEILKGVAVVMIDPLTGRALGAADFFLAHQPDALLAQANPVSTTVYNVVPTTANVRILSLTISCVWAVTQPTPIDIVVTIDGNAITFRQTNPVSGTDYYPWWHPANALIDICTTDADIAMRTWPLLEGRSVRVDAIITWGVTQPTFLYCRVKWARR